MPYWADASYVIGLADTRDQWHEAAKSIRARLGDKNAIRTHPLAIAEVTNRLVKSAGIEVAEKTYMLMRDRMEIAFPHEQDLDDAMDLVVQYAGELSLSDALFVHLMGPKDVVLSFDKGFDGKVKRMPS